MDDDDALRDDEEDFGFGMQTDVKIKKEPGVKHGYTATNTAGIHPYVMEDHDSDDEENMQVDVKIKQEPGLEQGSEAASSQPFPDSSMLELRASSRSHTAEQK